MWNSLENVACMQQKLKERWKSDEGKNGQKEKARMTSELAAHPSASQSLRQHEYQSAAADRQDQMKKGEEEREQGLWGNDEAVKGNNCRCIFFFFFKAQGRPTHANVSGDASEQPVRYLSRASRKPPGSCIVHWSRFSLSQAGIVLGQQEEACSLSDRSLGLVLRGVCDVVSLCVSCVRLLVCACSDVSVRGKCSWKNTTRRKVSRYWESTGRGTQENYRQTSKLCF